MDLYQHRIHEHFHPLPYRWNLLDQTYHFAHFNYQVRPTTCFIGQFAFWFFMIQTLQVFSEVFQFKVTLTSVCMFPLSFHLIWTKVLVFLLIWVIFIFEVQWVFVCIEPIFSVFFFHFLQSIEQILVRFITVYLPFICLPK
jgi:hypothetical protein